MSKRQCYCDACCNPGRPRHLAVCTAPIPGLSYPVHGPVRHVRRCIDGRHITGGECGHGGGVLIDGSCYVRSALSRGDSRDVLTRRVSVDGVETYERRRVRK